MKKIKLTALCLALALFIGLLASCGGGTSNRSGGGATGSSSKGGTLDGSDTSVNHNVTLTGKVTLKKFLDSGPKVGFYGKYPLDKNSKPEKMYLFEDGKIYLVYSFDENGTATDDYQLTWGEISKMSDDELLAHARKYKTSHGRGHKRALWFDSNDPNFDNQQGETVEKPGDTWVEYDSNYHVDYTGLREYEDGKLYGVVTVHYHQLGHNEDSSEFLIDADGNLYFAGRDTFDEVIYYPTVMDPNSQPVAFDEITPYDGRCGEIRLPKFTFIDDFLPQMITCEYSFSVRSDKTGNLVTKEYIDVDVKYGYGFSWYIETVEFGREPSQAAVISLYNTPSAKGVVYDSTFTVLFEDEDKKHGLIFRTGNDLSLTLDKIGDEGIEVID